MCVWKEEAENVCIYTYLQQISTYTENSSLKFKSQFENKFSIHIFGFLIFSSNQNSSGLIVLPFHYSSTQKLPQLRHLSYHGMRFSLTIDCSPCPVLSTIVSQLFPPHNHLQTCGHQEFASVLQTDNNSLAPDMSSMQDVPRSFRFKFICHVNSLS
jgi:hypothetical protein